MDLSIAALLAQDGVTNGAIYALLALALVLVFAVTRVIFVPPGEFVAYGALTLARLQLGKPPGTVWLLLGWPSSRRARSERRRVRRATATGDGCRGGWRSWLGRAARRSPRDRAWAGAAASCRSRRRSLLTLAIVTPLGPLLYRLAYQPLADATRAGAADRLGRRALRADRPRPVFFGAEGSRTPSFSDASLRSSARVDVQRAEPARRRRRASR